MTESTPAPLVTLLIPTCNRAESAFTCLASAINITFSDCEILLSDNSSHPSDRGRIDSFARDFGHDSRFRLIRPGKFLNMADHWEWATHRASGRYVAIVTDRHAARPSMLTVIADHLRTSSPDVLVWNVRSGFSEAAKMERTSRFTGKLKNENPKDVLRAFLSFSGWRAESMFMQNLPRGLNSIYKNELAARIRSKHGRLFFPLSPDYTSAFLLLANANNMSYVDLPFYTSFGNKSNGQRSSTEGIRRYASTYPGLDPFAGCPTRIDCVFNTLLRDFLAMQKLEEELREFSYDLKGYYLSLYREILLKELWGSPTDTNELRKMWAMGVEQTRPDVKQEILSSLMELKEHGVKRIQFRKLLYKTKLLPFVKTQIEWGRRLKSKLQRKRTYSSVLEAVFMTDHYLHNSAIKMVSND